MNKKKWKRRAKESEAELRHACDEHRKGIADLNHEIGRLEKENDTLQEKIAKQGNTIDMQAKTIAKFDGVPDHLGPLIRDRVTTIYSDKSSMITGEKWLTPWLAHVEIVSSSVADFGRERDVYFAYSNAPGCPAFKVPVSEYLMQKGGVQLAGWRLLEGAKKEIVKSDVVGGDADTISISPGETKN